MLVSTKGRYALRVMGELAANEGDNYMSLKGIAESQDISEKYLEGIIKLLVEGGLVVGVRGKGGGYKLAKPASKITAYDIISLAEEGLATVGCLKDGQVGCERKDICSTLPMWKGLDDLVQSYLEEFTLEDISNM